jgi:hypothetical protein
MALPEMLGCVPRKWSRQQPQGPLTSGRSPLVRMGVAAKTFEVVSRSHAPAVRKGAIEWQGVGAGRRWRRRPQTSSRSRSAAAVLAN